MTSALPFFRRATKTELGCAWDVTPSGDYAEDCASGRRLADAFMRHAAGDLAGTSMLGHVVREMVNRGPDAFSGIEIGFLGEIMRHAEAAADAVEIPAATTM